MDPPSPPCPYTVTVRRNPHRRARPTPATVTALPEPSSSSLSSNPSDIPVFRIDDVLAMNVSQNAPSKASNSLTDSKSESLKVFLRIRPLSVSGSSRMKSSKPSAARNVWPKSNGVGNVGKEKLRTKKSISSVITVNDDHSVTVRSSSDLNRSKSELFKGFSHVFSPDSTQDEVYEKVVNPIVEDFLNGRSRMLVAVGPTGSGKTYTVFGSARAPGLVPRALRRLLEPSVEKSSNLTRSFYLSMFEICQEKGKGEKLFDLSPDGGEIFLQQSVVKGLKEVLITDSVQAESLIACGMLKRATAATNSNSQSSRSQCIINIRCTTNEIHRGNEPPLNGAVLTFVDLAGAEREKKTGNQGGRLLESNFINNTSMVFGLCLRSLLEHQKNPKKPLQKHFQNSLLTKYLREYLEGKKRMALILTVRSGEEDYPDSSFLLRQASPCMEIKFHSAEDTATLPQNKRQYQAMFSFDRRKKLKLSHPSPGMDDKGNTVGDSNKAHRDIEPIDIKDAEPIASAGSQKDRTSEGNDNVPLKENCADAAAARDYCVMQGLAKALWKVLKQYKEKVKVMQNEIDNLKENLTCESSRYSELEKELNDLKSRCTCPKEVPNNACVAKQDSDVECRGSPSQSEVSSQSEILQRRHSTDVPKASEEVSYPAVESPESKTVPEQHELSEAQVQHTSSQVDTLSFSASMKNLESLIEYNESEASARTEQAIDALHLDVETSEKLSYPDINEKCEGSHSNAHRDGCHKVLRLKEEDTCSNNELTDISTLSEPNVPVQRGSSVSENGLIDSKEDKENDAPAEGRKANSAIMTPKVSVPHSKPSNAERPRRRLQPASSVLLRDISNMDLNDENEKLMGAKNGRRMAEVEIKRSTGNNSLLRLLKETMRR